MKTIGLIGGMSWESTADYYRLINEGVKQALGGLHSAKILLYSVDFADIEALQKMGKWDEAGEILSGIGQNLESAGAEGLVLCTNTMHQVADKIEAKISIPFLHIADATGKQLVENGIQKVGLLGTQFTMERDFYKGRLHDAFGLEVIVPELERREEVHRVIFQELCVGEITESSKKYFLETISALRNAGAEAVILGCTEIGMLVTQADTSVPIFDTTKIHVDAVVQWLLVR